MNKNNNILAVVITFAVVLGLAFGGDFVVNKVADRVIEKLQRDYSPGPYHPGFDPDKVSPDFFRQQQQVAPPPQQQQQMAPQMPPQYGFGRPEDWNRVWETQRR